MPSEPAMNQRRLRMVVPVVSGLLGATFALTAADRFAVIAFYDKHPMRLSLLSRQSLRPWWMPSAWRKMPLVA
jgi:hypothetical protein